MSHNHQHAGHEHHGIQSPRKRPIQHNWWFWGAIVLMLAAMVVYVTSFDEAIGPGGTGEQVPAAAP